MLGFAWPGLACVARVRPKVHRAGVPTRATHAGERLRMATGTDAGPGWQAKPARSRLTATAREASGSPRPSAAAHAPPVRNRRLPGKTGSKPVGWDGIGIAEPQRGSAWPNRRQPMKTGTDAGPGPSTPRRFETGVWQGKPAESRLGGWHGRLASAPKPPAEAGICSIHPLTPRHKGTKGKAFSSLGAPTRAAIGEGLPRQERIAAPRNAHDEGTTDVKGHDGICGERQLEDGSARL